MENPKIRAIELGETLNSLLSVPSYNIGAFTFDVVNRLLKFQTESTKLTKKETYLLVLFAANANKLIERKYILNTIWKDDSYLASRTMDVYVCKLRKLLSKDLGINIINIHGKGYKFLF
jgi:DNA-binding response OmpR family regulator